MATKNVSQKYHLSSDAAECVTDREHSMLTDVTAMDDNVPPTRLKDLAPCRIVKVLPLFLPPPTLSREVLRRVRNHVPRV